MLKMSRLPEGEPEIFSSIQGEGVSMGVPSVFVRLSLCNLRCTWCDTKYTWDWEHYDPKTEIVTLDVPEILHRVEAGKARNVVITGGEPLQQQRPLVALATALRQSGKRLEIETNGTYRPIPELADLINQWNVSPKLANSGNEPGKRDVPEAMTWFAAAPDAYFKFVVAGEDDLAEVQTLVARYAIPVERVLLMPEGRDPVALRQRSLWLVDQCREHGYRFSTRLHVILWGDKRGR